MTASPPEFRAAYLDHAQISAQLRTWAEEHPEHTALRSIGQTPGGRELWVLTIGRAPSRPRPAIWVDANMHATELCGTNVALAIAEDILALHRDPAARVHGLPAHVCDVLRDIHVHVMPRMSPDGAEVVVNGQMLVRSIPRDSGTQTGAPRWIPRDLNGDGQILTIRVEDPTGEFCESSAVPGLLVPRRITDAGPFYKVYPEGVIDKYDGLTVPSPAGFNNVGVDLNRNFPARWEPEPTQPGAGPYSLSEPESRAVVEFASANPTIFAWFNLHTFGGVFIRPPGDKPDTALDPRDRAHFDQVAVWAKEHTGYPTVGGFEHFTYVPTVPLHGDLLDFVYRERGCLAFAVELWDLFTQAGIRARQGGGERFVDVYTKLDREELEALGRWDREHNQGRCFHAWTSLEHPQLGRVELGGLDPRFGLWNPPPERLGALCEQMSAVFLRTAAMAPRVVINPPRIEPRGPGRHAIEIEVVNHGYLGSYGVHSAQARPWNEGLRAELVIERGADSEDALALDEPGTGQQLVGHLDGWGRGPRGDNAAAFYQRSRGSTGRGRARWYVRGSGTARVRVTGPRLGALERLIEIP